MKNITLWAAILCMAALPHAQAVTLLAWDPGGLSGTWPEDWSSTSQGGTVTVDSGVQITAGLGRGSGTSLAGLNNGWGAGSINQTTRSAAETDNDYLFFALSPQAGYEMSLSSLDFNIRIPQSGWDAGNSRYIWQYKVGDGSFTDIGTEQPLVGDYNTNGAAQPTIDLSGIAALQNITEAVEFRVYAWGTTGQFVFGRQTGDDLVLAGSVGTVPEPSRFLLLSAAFAGLALRRRRSLPC